MISVSISPVVNHEGCRERKEEMKSQLGMPRRSRNGDCEVDAMLPFGVPTSSLNGS
jgi:hypothetical protein